MGIRLAIRDPVSSLFQRFEPQRQIALKLSNLAKLAGQPIQPQGPGVGIGEEVFDQGFSGFELPGFRHEGSDQSDDSQGKKEAPSKDPTALMVRREG